MGASAAAMTIAVDDDHRRAGDEPEVERVDLAGEHAVQGVQADHVDGERHGGREDHGQFADVRLVLEEEGGHVEPGARGGEGREQGEVPVSPTEGPVAEAVQQLGARDHEVHPPHPERESDAGEPDERRLDGPPIGTHDRVERGDGAEDHLSERDDRQQPVPLGDVMRVPRRDAEPALGDDRTGQLDDHEHRGDREHDTDRGVGHQQPDPADLGDEQRDGVGECATSAARRRVGRHEARAR